MFPMRDRPVDYTCSGLSNLLGDVLVLGRLFRYSYKCRNQLVQKVSREAHEKSLCIDTLVRRDF